MTNKYTIEEQVTVNADGFEVETTRSRWVTARELMEEREPEVDWEQVEAIRRRFVISPASGGRIRVANTTKAVEHKAEIMAAKPHILALAEAEREIVEAKREAWRRADEEMAEHDAFASRFYARDSDL